MKKLILFLSVVALFITTGSAVFILQEVYINNEFNISLRYPEGWKVKEGYVRRYEGKDGFFQIDALTMGSDSIDSVAKSEANHKLMPYGSSPTIRKLTVDTQQARLILPSGDQAPGMKGQAALIVKYPHPITIASEKYKYLILWVDMGHIKDIGNSLKFIKK